MHPRALELIATLDLSPHPEGGFFKEVFRSTSMFTPDDGRKQRSALTTIYYLLAAGTHSRWHRVTSDEVWHLYEGGPLELLELNAAGDALHRHHLAPVGVDGGAPVHTIRAGHWQAARPVAEYALMGCTVGPGFEFDDFTLLADDLERAAAVRRAWPDVAKYL